MATLRNNPFGAFNFLVSLGEGDEGSVIAGFSDVADEMQIVFGLDQAGLRAALVIALAERG